jgi:sec-independent protein translocase protein TatA
MGNLGPTELIIIALVIVLLFGASRLPSTARAIGRSMRIFKAETKGLREDDDADNDTVGKDRDQKQALPPAQQGPQVAPPLEQTQSHKDRH